jgi:hypothetical protein
MGKRRELRRIRTYTPAFPYGKIPFGSEASDSEALSKELDYKIVQVMITK